MTMDWLWNDSIDGVMECGTSFIFSSRLVRCFFFFFIAGTRRIGIEKKGGEAGDGAVEREHSKVEIRAQVWQ